MILSKTRNSTALHVGHLGKAIRQSGKRIRIMSPILQSEIIIFATPQQHRVNLYKNSLNLPIILFFSEGIPTVVTEMISVVLRKN